MREATWKVIDWGDVPEDTPPRVPFTCAICGAEAMLPIIGSVIAQIDDGLVFDVGRYAMPQTIQCRQCRRKREAA